MEGRAPHPMPQQQAARPKRWGRLLRLPSAPCLTPRTVRAEELPAEEAPPAAASAEPKAPDDAPVQFEMFTREWQNMSQQDNWDGFRIEVANKVTKYLQAAHTMFLGTQLRETGYIYQFGPAFQSEDQSTVMVARAGLDGAVNGRWIQKVGKSMELKASTNSHLKEAQRNMHEGSLEYNGSDWTTSGKLAWQGAWVLCGAFTQRIVPSLHLGGQLDLVLVNGVTSIGQIGARWQEGRDIFNANISRMPNPATLSQSHECKLNYVRKVTDRLSLGTEFMYKSDGDSGLSFAYEYIFRQARVQGLLDTDGKVSCCVSDFIGFGFSGAIDYARGDYKFGMVMHVLPQPEEGQQPMM